MFHLRGSPALSVFRINKLLRQLQEHVPELVGVAAEYLHLVELEERLSEDERSILEQLLTYGPDKTEQEPAGVSMIVVPRSGTISPWSSKATDIVHNCGLDKVRRVERGIVYTLMDNSLAVLKVACLFHNLHQHIHPHRCSCSQLSARCRYLHVGKGRWRTRGSLQRQIRG